MHIRSVSSTISTAVAASLALLLTGCAGITSTSKTSSVPAAGALVHGAVHGGQQPISGATIQLFVAGTGGYAQTNANILTSPITTGLDGSFTLTGTYPCTPGQLVYLVATGGYPGLPASQGGAPNPNAAVMAALGDCGNLTTSTYIDMNEVTTVGSVFALAPFMSGYANFGAGSGNVAGLNRAFASVNKLVNIGAGSSSGSALPSGATGPSSEINTLADVMATCINSSGGAAGDATFCGMFFSLATPPGGAAPTDTVAAVLNIAHHPALNAAALWSMTSATSPFQPTLAKAPADWTMSVVYGAAGLNKPVSTSIDSAGQVWIANSGNSSVTVLAQTGAPLATSPLTGNGLSAPSSIAIDAGGNAWVANKGGNSLSAFSSAGVAISGSPFSGGGLSSPSALAIDPAGNLWIANSGNNSLSEFSKAGAPLGQTSGFSSPASLAIHPN